MKFKHRRTRIPAMLEKEGDLFGETRSKIDRVYVPEMALAAARICPGFAGG